jgi:hypothetical protein
MPKAAVAFTRSRREETMKRIVFSVVALLVLSAFTLPAAAPRPGSSQTGQSVTSLSGKLTARDGKFFMTDDVTKATVEVRGEGLQRWVGKNVRLTGQMTPAAAGQPAVFSVSQVSQAAAVGGKAAAAGVKGGLSKAAVVAIAGGATAGTVGGLYAADVIGGDEEPVSRR